MSTVNQKLISNLVNKGMSEQQAGEVIKIAIPEINKEIKDYNITLESVSTDYPEVIFDILMMRMKPIALKWIEENKPHAFFKPMFQ